MSTTTTPPEGITRMPSGKYRVRVRFSQPWGRTSDVFDTLNESLLHLAKLNDRKANGLPPYDESGDPTLREAADELLQHKRTSRSRRTKRPLTANGLKHWRVATLPWREGSHANTRLSLLNRDKLETTLQATALVNPTTARNHREGLNAVLRYAAARHGARFDQRILGIEPPVVEPRERRALTMDELEWLASHAPKYAQRLVLFLGTTGLRSGEAFTLTDDRVELDGPTPFVAIPAGLNKEKRDKAVALGPDEVELLREQLGGLRVVTSSATSHLPSRAAGTPLVFPKAQGGAWDTSKPHFHKLVWNKATTRAAAAWRAEYDLSDDEPTPFDDLTPHDLRSTAATLMRDVGMSKDAAADRLGHASTRLLDDVYDQGDRMARVARELAEVAPDGLRAEAAARRAATHHAPLAPADREGI